MKVLRSTNTLQHLSLKSNNINENGLTIIGESLNKNSTLKSLSLFGNNFNDDTSHLFDNIMKENMTENVSRNSDNSRCKSSDFSVRSDINPDSNSHLNSHFLTFDFSVYTVDGNYFTAEENEQLSYTS